MIEFVIVALATHRLTDLIVEDTITEPLRRFHTRLVRSFWWRIAAGSAILAAADAAAVTVHANGGGDYWSAYAMTVGVVLALWCFFAPFFAELIRCAMCASVWASAAVVGVYAYYAGLNAAQSVLWAAAASSATIIINTVLTRLMTYTGDR